LIKNEYKIVGNIVEFYITRKNGDVYTIIIDLEDLHIVDEINYKMHVGYHRNIDGFYAEFIDHSQKDENGKHKQRTLLLHRVIFNPPKGWKVDHINHNTLDNRKENLRLIDTSQNATHRKGANKNSGTGVRNVNYGRNHEEYWVQFQKKGERFKWEFPLNQFDEACKFANKKRKELFGEYSGVS
jgi:hypothetical protein